MSICACTLSAARTRSQTNMLGRRARILCVDRRQSVWQLQQHRKQRRCSTCSSMYNSNSRRR